MMETETAEFVVELDRPNVQVKWMKDGSELLEDDRVKFVYEDTTYKVVIPDANKSDIEQYICILPDGQKSKAMLAVTGRLWTDITLCERRPTPFVSAVKDVAWLMDAKSCHVSFVEYNVSL